jgi:polar amino acid transport system ATP-binding protein
MTIPPRLRCWEQRCCTANCRSAARDGMTMLLATHEMGFARKVASKVCFLYGGRVHEEGLAEQIFNKPDEERTRIIEAGRL